TRGPLAMDLVILKYIPVTRMAPELALRSPNIYVTPIGGRFSLDRFKVHRPVLQGESSVAIVSNS
ncbi:hypothetical protein TNCV_4506701, partial [Trichonephila clavipes]